MPLIEVGLRLAEICPHNFVRVVERTDLNSSYQMDSLKAGRVSKKALQQCSARSILRQREGLSNNCNYLPHYILPLQFMCLNALHAASATASSIGSWHCLACSRRPHAGSSGQASKLPCACRPHFFFFWSFLGPQLTRLRRRRLWDDGRLAQDARYRLAGLRAHRQPPLHALYVEAHVLVAVLACRHREV